MRRLHPRGAASRGICVDAVGATLGPECVLVRSTSRGFSAIARDAAFALQKCVLPAAPADGDWLYRQTQRIADALNAGEVALAQIYGLRILASDLQARDLRRIAAVSALCKAGFNPAEPRVPRDDPRGGRWTDGNNPPAVNAPEDRPATTEIDFSDGFHDAVVDSWIKAFNDSGKAVGLRMIGTDGAIIGFPDILIHAPGLPVEAIEVKTGNTPTFTPNQRWYIPLLKVGGHLYSTDTRIEKLGLVPGQVFPPTDVYVICAPGPGQKYKVRKFPF